ncbi:MAG: tetratricopeptide repeat protein [Cyanothece sp. SIO1E1]|nr:tetratricopeptide repeat protein [Cyanothece sp. SIO1E1]
MRPHYQLRWQQIAIACLCLGTWLPLNPLIPAAQAQGTPATASNLPANTERAFSLLREGREKLWQQDYRGAIANFNQAVQLAPNEANPYFNRGLVRFFLEDQLGALSDFDNAVLRDPNHAFAYLYRAGILLSLGSQTEAITDLQHAAQLFSEQGNQQGYQRAADLLQHFNPASPPLN